GTTRWSPGPATRCCRRCRRSTPPTSDGGPATGPGTGSRSASGSDQLPRLVVRVGTRARDVVLRPPLGLPHLAVVPHGGVFHGLAGRVVDLGTVPVRCIAGAGRQRSG